MIQPPPILSPEALASARVPGLLRRLAIIVYDLMLVFGVLFVAAAMFVVPVQMLTGSTVMVGPSRFAFQLWLIAVILLYFGYFWSRGRQTLAMRAWRTRLVRDDGAPLGPADAMRRLLFTAVTLMPFGVGLLWVLFDPQGLSWYDRLSRTRPVLLAKSTQTGRNEQGA